MAKQWYVVHAYSNFEGKVKASLQEHIRLAGIPKKEAEADRSLGALRRGVAICSFQGDGEGVHMQRPVRRSDVETGDRTHGEDHRLLRAQYSQFLHSRHAGRDGRAHLRQAFHH